MKNIKYLFIFILLVFAGCAKKVSFDVLRPARYNIADITRIAVLDFQGPGNAGQSVSTRFADRLWKTGFLSLVERNELQKILEEHALNMSGVVNDSTAVEFGKILGVDAIILGNVFSYKCEDIRSTEKVKENVWTGKYERDKDGKIKYEKTLFGKQKKKIYKEEYVEKSFIKRDATVGISFRIVSVETGEIRASDSRTKSFGQKYANDFSRIPPRERILNELSDQIINQFIPLIAPHKVRITKQFEEGNDAVNLGIEMAKNNLWDKARDLWEKETRKHPENPTAFYNLGIAYEVLGDLDESEKAYDRALNIEPKEIYMRALASIRKRIDDQQKLDGQIRRDDFE